MTKEEIKAGNKLIAEYMGYKYHHPGIDIDESDCGGIYTRREIFSKIPIESQDFPEQDQYYFKDVKNPDYGNENPKRWRSDWEFLSWSSIYNDQYIADPTYDSDWNELMPVCKKIFDSYFSDREYIYEALHKCDLDKTFESVCKFLVFWNDPNQEKMIWVTTPEWVLEFIKDHKVKDFRPLAKK